MDIVNSIKDAIKSVITTKPSVVIKCSCGNEIPEDEAKRAYYVCPKCGKYIRISARARIDMVCDAGSFKELYPDYQSRDFMHFPGYAEKLQKATSATGEKEAVICGTGKIGGEDCAIFVMDPRFIMASMGSVVGEKITLIFERALKEKLPVVGFTASGGARMKEGIIYLMQMAKVSGSVSRLSEAAIPYITVVTDPTTGGVTASFAMQGDIILAEPKALIGFAGRRVVEQTTKTELPQNFQTAEFLLEHGFVDAIVTRDKLKSTLANLLRMHKRIV